MKREETHDLSVELRGPWCSHNLVYLIWERTQRPVARSRHIRASELGVQESLLTLCFISVLVLGHMATPLEERM